MLRVAIVGCGAFSASFIPFFRDHPFVDGVVLADLDAAKVAAAAQAHAIAATAPSLEAVCADPAIDAVALFTQNWLHGPQAVAALRASKHVYSAVPPGITVAQVEELVAAATASGRVYMLGETSYYYPAVVYCRQRFRTGDFGRPVYAEAEYIHDFDHGLYEVMKWRGGERWREVAGSPPMHYPTHSTSQILSITGARMTSVSCLGFVDDHGDGLFGAGANRWDNPFSNESALFAMSDGSACRINEWRRVGHPGAVRMSLYGTRASFEQHLAGARWVTRDPGATENLDAAFACTGVAPAGDAMAAVAGADGTHEGMARVHPIRRLPRAYAGIRSGHSGSHAFLVDDFVRACVDGAVPPNHVWAAARYALPGILAHESAVRRGERLEVPDLGDPPADPVEYVDPPAAAGAA